jgi:hypothetical protein
MKPTLVIAVMVLLLTVRGAADHPMAHGEVPAKGPDLVASAYGKARGAQVVDAVMALKSLANGVDLRPLLTEA